MWIATPNLDVDQLYILRHLSLEPWKAEDHPEVSAWLDAHAAVVTGLLQIGQMEKCRWPIYAKYDCRWPVPHRKLAYGADLLILTGKPSLR